jgi:nucleotide-binding universal stress UspA family protein
METMIAQSPETLAEPVVAPGPILVATDGTPQSDGALRAAIAFAPRLHAAPQVLAVHEPFVYVSPEAQVVFEPNATASRRAELLSAVQTQVDRAAGREPLGNPEIRDGSPAHVIARTAAERGAQLVVVGIGRHDIVDRFFGSETAIKLIRHCGVPVLAVPESFAGVPRHVVVAIDFSDASVRAARAAMRLVDPGAVIEFVHVMPRERMLADWWESEERYQRFVQLSFGEMLSQLDVPPGITVRHTTLRGNPAVEVLRYAAQAQADLIAAGSHGHGFVARTVVGSVATKLLRGAECAVLVLPRDAVIGALEATEANMTRYADRQRWCTRLDEFTRKNAGRRTRLEVDDPDIGAQAQEHDYPLRGVSYDSHDDRIEIMLGDQGLGRRARHLSRGIAGADAVDVLSDAGGRDIALRVRHGQGQTLLTFVA